MISLKALEAEQATEERAATVPIRDLGGEQYTNAKGEPVAMKVLGQHSAPVRAARTANERRLYKLRVTEYSPELGFENRVRVAAAALVEWGVEDEVGAPVPLTLENVRAVCKAAPWILEQVESASFDHARFFLPGSLTS